MEETIKVNTKDLDKFLGILAMVGSKMNEQYLADSANTIRDMFFDPESNLQQEIELLSNGIVKFV